MGILLGLALVWLTAWSIVSCACYRSGRETLAQAEQLRTPTVTLEPGEDVRVEGTLVSAPNVRAPFSERPCLAAHTVITASSHWRDAQDHEQSDVVTIKELRVGPTNLQIAVGERRIELPLELWTSRDRISEGMGTLPDRLGVSEQEEKTAIAKLRGSFGGYTVSERTLDGGDHVFVVAKLGPDGMHLEADRLLERVELYVGTQEQYVAEQVRSGNTSITLAYVFGPIGLPPILVVGLVLLLRRRKEKADA